MAKSEGAAPELRCEICGLTDFSTPRGLKTHMGMKHKGAVQAAPKKRSRKPETSTSAAQGLTSAPEPAEAVEPEKVGVEEDVPYEEPPTTPFSVPAPLKTSVHQSVEVPVGAFLLLNCVAWKLDSVTQQWVPRGATQLKVQVSSRVPSGNGILLYCKDDSGGVWSITEEAVFSGQVSWTCASPEVEAPPVEEPPRPEPVEPTPEPVPEPAPAEEPVAKNSGGDLEEFLGLAERYLELKETFEIARNAFESFADLHERTLKRFILQNGTDGYFKSKSGKLIGQVSSDPTRGVVYDEAAIIEWCQENGQDDLLTLKFDVVKWTRFKESLGEALNSEGFKEILAKVESGETETVLSLRKI